MPKSTLVQRIKRTLGMAETRLHIGAGPVQLEGWINIDNQPYEGLDHVLDVTAGLPFSNVDYIFAEHFVEHLSYDAGLAFLKECRRALAKDGVLRLTTPNLDWVWLTQYHPGQWATDGEAVRDCFWMNKSFRAWGHQFLYNFQTLKSTLLAAGFGEVKAAEYGVSEHEALRNLEHHEKYPDAPEASHLIVAEASGFGVSMPTDLQEPLSEYRQVIGIV
jgi:predicted SAM-dependent methyltransferase